MAENRPYEPRPDDIAVVGAGCRFPGGVRDLDGLWRVLMDGVDVVTPVPGDRWSDEFHHPDRHTPGTTYCREGGFLDDIDRFDADYFGVSPREARGMDPQQRLLLEVCSEAMEDAGVPRGAWEGSRTSVHMGILGSDYLLLHARTSGIKTIDPYFASGKEFSFAAGRIAYTFGLHGPAMTVNTACSSSLVAVHLACQALRNGEADTALAGGVNVIVAPELSVFMGKVQALSPTGRCRPFDARADGIVRGEGCGVVVLKRYADAVRDHDRIHGLIRGSAVNQDGRSAGLTAPNALAQQELLRAALKSASVAPEEPVFVEAHGTGTPLGDPLEISALTEVIGRTRPADRPLLVGSHKAHFGHMDSAAGIAGLLKTMLVLRHRTVPGQIHHVYPAPMIDWESSGTLVPVNHVTLPDTDESLTAGVSAFGLSGTNAHVVLGSAPRTEAVDTDGPHTLLVSATTADGLRQLAADYASTLADPVGPVAAASAVRRTHHKHRIAVVGKDAAELTAALAEAEGSRAADVAPKVVHVFSGQGSQWPRMGLDLAETEPVVRETLDACDELLRAEVGWSLYDVLRDADPARVRATDVAQPAVFSVQVALARLWQSWGVRPDAVIGHSMGEVAAAHVAGALELGDAVRLVAHRGRLMHRAAGTGRMANVELGADQVRERLAARHPEVCVATENGPASVVVAGPQAAVEAAVRELADAGANVVQLPVDYAFHSPLMQPYADELADLLRDLTPNTPTVPFLSTAVPGDPVPLDAAYWAANIREPVRLWPVVDALLAEGETAFVEIGAHPVLARPLQASLAHRERRGPVVSSLYRAQPGPTVLARSRATLHEAGIGLDWAAVHGAPVPPVTLPPHRWADERYWLEGVERGEQGAGPAERQDSLDGLRAEVRLVDSAGRVVAELGASAEASAEAPAAVAAPAPVAAEPAPVAVPEAAPASHDREQVAATVHNVLAKVLGHGPRKRLPRTRGFFELGIDSISVAEFARRVAQELRVAVDGADALAHGTIDGFTDYIMTLTPEEPVVAAAEEEGATVGETSAAAPSGVSAPCGGAADGHSPAPLQGATPDPDDEQLEPIAVIGIGCRLPGGVSGPEDFWRLLDAEVDASGDVPARRWDAAALEGVPARGSFLDEVDGFDNSFFRISPREARTMDPQQRLFLEVAWEALEDAGVPADRMSGTRTGVFVGLNTTDYQQLVTRRESDVDLYYGTGNSFSATAGRISYFLGLRGPSIAVDTACSSSLTAVHLACQSLRAGESRLALAGGVNVMATPTVFLSMGAAGALAPDGRCKTFDDSADGYGRGEGAGVVILKRLSSAVRDGDRVYAIIRGSAVNQDGASGGFTVPSGTAQEEVIRTALENAGVAPHEVSYVEAHGTGTRLGDAVELRALAGALGSGRPDGRPLVVGSVKTNVGHLEAAAGVTGLIKTVLSLGRERIPAQLHLTTPTRQLDWERLPLDVAGAPVPWPRGDRPRIAGISAFGFTGTNAHVLVQEAPEQPAPPVTRPARPCVLTVSAVTPDALTDAVRRMRERILAADESELAALCWTSGARRAHLAHRVTAVGRTRDELVRSLDGARPVKARDEATVMFVYGRTPADLTPNEEVLAGDPAGAEAYRAVLAEARAALREELGEPEGPAHPGSVEHAGEVFAGHLATTALWRALGVEPDAVVGWDIGEYAAAVVAGDLTLVNAVRLLAAGVPVPAPAEETAVPRYSAADGWASLAGEVATAGLDVLLDIGTGSRAIRMLGAALDAAAESGEAAPAQLTAPRRRQPSGVEKAYIGPVELLELAGALHANGVAVDWDRLVPGPHRPVPLPAYPWQRKAFWVDTPYSAEPRRQPEQPAAPEPTATEPTGALAAELLGLPPDRREERLVDLLLTLVAQVLGEDADVAPDQGFFDLGMDSVLSQDLKQRAERELGVELPGTVVFECPNVASFARFVVDEVLTAPQDQAEPAGAAEPDEPAEGLEDPADLDDDALLSRLDGALASSEALLTEGD